MNYSLVLLFLLLFFSSSAFSEGGASGGGGGHSVVSVQTGERILYDLLYADIHFKDSYGVKAILDPTGIESSTARQIRAQYGEFAKTLGVDLLAQMVPPEDTSNPKKVAIYLLGSWKQTVDLTAHIAESIRWIDVEKEDTAITSHKSYILKYEKPMKKWFHSPELLAYYPDNNNVEDFDGSKLYQVHLIQPRIGSLGFYSQVGIYIHEALRHYQLMERTGKRFFSDIAIQKATNLILFCKPNMALAHYVLVPLLENGVDNGANDFISQCYSNPRFQVEPI